MTISLWGALAGGAVGTVVLTNGLRIAQARGWTRMDIPLLLGTIFTDNRGRASAIGYAVHFANGLLFALGYYAIFKAVGHAGWLFGALLGVVHAALAGGILVTVLLPVVHPRMGTPWSDAEETPILEPRERPDGQLLQADDVGPVGRYQPHRLLEEPAALRRLGVPVEDVPGTDEERHGATSLGSCSAGSASAT